MLINPSQIRAARGLLDWTVATLAEKVGVGTTTISAIETGRSAGSLEVLTKIVYAFQGAGVEFTAEGGIRPIQNKVTEYAGQNGFEKFLDDVYETVKYGGDILVANVIDDVFVRSAGKKNVEHIDRMSKIKNLKCKTLCKKNYSNFVSKNYTEYRWIDTDEFEPVPFYLYGDKLAIIIFQPELKVFIISSSEIAKAYKNQFMTLWRHANAPIGDE